MNAKSIINIRNQLGISQEEFARLLDVSFATVNRWENGKCKPSRMAQKSINTFCEKNGITVFKEGDPDAN